MCEGSCHEIIGSNEYSSWENVLIRVIRNREEMEDSISNFYFGCRFSFRLILLVGKMCLNNIRRKLESKTPTFPLGPESINSFQLDIM